MHITFGWWFLFNLGIGCELGTEQKLAPDQFFIGLALMHGQRLDELDQVG